MKSVVYAHDGESVYDSFFLKHLAKNNRVYLVTFNKQPNHVAKGAHVVTISEPFHPTTSPLTGVNAFLGSFLRSFLLRLRLREIEYDILIGCGGLLYGFYTAVAHASPFILLIWGSDVLVAPRFLPYRFMSKYSLKKARAVVVDSEVQEKACIRLGCDPRKIVKFPWVDLETISRCTQDTLGDNRNGLATHPRMLWNPEDPVIISTRHHEPVYNLECLISAIPRVVKEVPNARFLILGKGSLTKKLKTMVSTFGMDANVRFVGQVPFDDIPKFLKMADVYVSTSLSDGTSASLIEAMACMVPVTVTDIAGNREWITDNKSGLLFPTRDSQVLAGDILRLLKDDKLGSMLAAKAHETVLEKADWKRNSRLLDALISSMEHISTDKSPI